MKPSSVVYTTALLWSVGFAMSHAVSPAAAAATFDQKDMEQERVIAVAVPLAQGARYNLLILEQLSNAKQCWQANPGNPGTIDPLLLKFDFTNICGRSTDSNGYSVRIAGQDKGMDYRLSIAKENDRLVLLAVPSRNSQEPTLEIARSENLAAGFLKLQLNPEWRFTKRAYSGKTLGHIYLTRDSSTGGNYIAARPGTSASRSASNSQSLGVSPSRSSLQTQPQRKTIFSGGLAPITAPIQIPVPAPTGSQRLRQPPIFTARAVSTAPLENDRNGLPNLSAGVLPVPTSNIPMGNAGHESDIITASTPSLNLNAMAPGMAGGGAAGAPFQMAMVNPKYRVFVNATDRNQQKMVKTLVPDSFRSSYQGRPMLQVGAFQDRAQANEVIDLLNRNGINSILAGE
ncbi:DUF3747 domain-containing protein [Altericista sp. CCNU0014]|uniref:DUF3747 domain-containing protein n=1 Tax=Altericista sp. CCNU0014 TaxID=3082949 RepID=UPI00384B9E5E